MVDAVHVGGDKHEPQHAIEPGRQLHVAVIEQRRRVEQHFEQQDRECRHADEQHRCRLDQQGQDDLEAAFRRMVEEKAEALLVLPDARLTDRMVLGRLALKSGLPTMFGSREDLAVGSLMAYGPSRFDLVRRAASYVEKILNGAKPADLPVQQPVKFELIVNLATARALGITIPPPIIAQADEVIE